MRKDVKMKTQQEYIEQGEQYILKTYNRFPVVLEKGKVSIYMMLTRRNIWILVQELLYLH